MRIGIIGAGGAGLAAAWLLEEDHDVVLFERDAMLGGHAHTVDVDAPGRETLGVEGAFEFFSERMFPTFVRYLRLLDVPFRPYPMTITVHSTDHRVTTLAPPIRFGDTWRFALGPRRARRLLALLRMIRASKELVEGCDRTTTIGDFFRGLAVDEGSRTDFLEPFLRAGWCVGRADFERFIASDVLSYWYRSQVARFVSAPWLEIEGGMRSYVDAVARQLGRATVRRGSPIRRIQRRGSDLVAVHGSGEAHAFDRIVLATNAAIAGSLLDGLAGAEAARDALGRVRYFQARIAIHGDRRLMPRERADWSVVNVRFDAENAHTTVFRRLDAGPPVFKSWVTYEKELPQPLYHLVTYDHPMVDRVYFETQARLQALQGEGSIFHAGMHVHDVDCHESAICSAVEVACRLAPDGGRLRRLAPEVVHRERSSD